MTAADGPRPAVVLVRPQEEGNVGATARAMANMGLSELVVVEPAAPFGATARAFAVGAGDILERARRVASLDAALAPFRRAVGTTSSRGRVASRPPLAPRDLAELAAAGRIAAPWAVVFGPEPSGLTGDELARMDPLVSVPCAPEQPTLNLAQAVLVIAYELRLAGAPKAAPGQLSAAPPTASLADLDRLMQRVGKLLHAIGFARDDSFAGVLRDLRRLLGRAAPSRREATILLGICRRAGHALAARAGSRNGVGGEPAGDKLA